MKKITSFVVISLASAMLFGCAGFDASGKKGMIGGGAGAGAGALLGQMIGHNTQSTLIGTAVGGMLGYIIGNEMDKSDRTQVNNTFEHGQSNQPVAWSNPDSGAHYTMTPQPIYHSRDGKVCRNANILAHIDGRAETVTTTACRESNGAWVLKS